MLQLLYVLLACRPAPSPAAGTEPAIDSGEPSTGDDDDGGDDDDDDTPPTDSDTATPRLTADSDTGPSPTGATAHSGCPDGDGDGVDSCTDCDDTDPGVFPGADERCNGLDDDCDGYPLPDEVDADGDGTYDCATCDEAGYWLATRELSGSALETAVADTVAGQTCSDYGDAREFLFAELDNDNGTIECRYTGRTRGGVGSGYDDWEDMNTEHTWPRSQGSAALPAECDLHHLFITDATTNSQRGSYPFGEVVSDTLTIDGDSRLGTDSSGTTVFEPRDSHKGNVARAMTYFAHRYGYQLSSAELSLYQAWHTLDPVDDAELARSFAIAEEQELANPFVTCPELLDAL